MFADAQCLKSSREWSFSGRAEEGKVEMKCHSCGSEVTHLQGSTGRVTICSRCGWGRVELADGGRSLGFGSRSGRWSVARRSPVSVGRREQMV
jgi:DNA-directed RNA polymerase subunit RPC12/RpoP